MPNILFFSENKKLVDDVIEQVSIYVAGYNIYREHEEEIIFDAIILDDLPHIFCHIRKKDIKIPIIYLHSGNVKNLPAVPTDVVIKKPFSLDVFLNKLRSSIYIFENSLDGSISFSDYELLPSSKEIIDIKTNESTKLTEKEVAILKYLYKAENRIVSRAELLQEVWGYNPDSTTHTIETHIYRLRNKVEKGIYDASPVIVTEDGGYRVIREVPDSKVEI